MLERKPEGLNFSRAAFADLPGWQNDALMEALPALLKSCEKIKIIPVGRRMPGASIGGTYGDWREACNAVETVTDRASLEQVLTTHFTPLSVSAGSNPDGVFTGYYEALLKGSLQETERFNVPLYSRPPELVMVDLGKFRPSLKGQRIAGSVKNGRLEPYSSRKNIEEGALGDRGLEILWVDSAVDAYFLHVQGSGRVLMPDGSFYGIGYAAQNGHANRLIGRRLIEMGAIARKDMSGQAIRQWLADNSDQMMDVLKTDPSFVFFRPLKNGDGPYGSANVVLTPGRSLAVDRKHLPLHAPVWLSASHPDPTDPTVAEVPLNRLMVAQDTGGAISGEIRGDVFWGFGDDAEEIAGRMANRGRYWLLLPNKLADKLLEQD
ncbi:murein transglycosylase A [Kordiimonas laminariae]|uniref:murein transglycosylase A n=1 Tax=Kordiimonas laminariae TaxID=2917717 RepID=UPI001FF64716|nr:MltA domain-containing protein [Kordiimonas laminariae]MCK0070188.1 MltA domain-containing protein [Kordiimonas laminariae]